MEKRSRTKDGGGGGGRDPSKKGSKHARERGGDSNATAIHHGDAVGRHDGGIHGPRFLDEYERHQRETAAGVGGGPPSKKAGGKRAPSAAAPLHRSNSGGGGGGGGGGADMWIAGPPAHPPAASAASTTANAGPRPHPTGGPPDPLLLARGMSSRYLSSRTAHRLLPLARADVERDLRHCEAHRAACGGYARQHFAYRNREPAGGGAGRLGAFSAPPPPIPRADAAGPAGAPARAPAAAGDAGGGGGAGARPDAPPASSAPPPPPPPAVPPSAPSPPMSFAAPPIMPIRIDPEEEKRLSLLRRRMHQSEFDREKLETQYLSLRAHYVHESRLARSTREYETGRWEAMVGMVRRRSKALGLMRARLAVARDVEGLLLAHRRRGRTSGGAAADDAARGDEVEAEDNDGADLVAIWNDLNSQLKAAESACVEFEIPAALQRMAAAAASSDSNGNKTNGSNTNGVRCARKRSNSVASEDETASSDCGNVKSDPSSSASSAGRKRAADKSKGGAGAEPHVIPWDCVVEPQTPYEVPLLMSCLSTATDKVVGYGKKSENFRIYVCFAVIST